MRYSTAIHILKIKILTINAIKYCLFFISHIYKKIRVSSKIKLIIIQCVANVFVIVNAKAKYIEEIGAINSFPF